LAQGGCNRAREGCAMGSMLGDGLWRATVPL